MKKMISGRRLPWDWHPGTIPDNVIFGDDSYIETSLSFELYRSQVAEGLRIGQGSAVYKDTMFDTGSHAQISIGDYVLIHGARIICDAQLEIGNYSLISWRVVLMDTYRLPLDPLKRRDILERVSQSKSRRLEADVPAESIRIGSNVWIGFDACVLPGVTIGEGSVVGARSVVTEDIPPYTIVAGNPARFIRFLDKEGINHDL